MPRIVFGGRPKTRCCTASTALRSPDHCRFMTGSPCERLQPSPWDLSRLPLRIRTGTGLARPDNSEAKSRRARYRMTLSYSVRKRIDRQPQPCPTELLFLEVFHRPVGLE